MKREGQIFLSYAKEDLAHVKKLYNGLKKRGLKVWFDEENLEPGEWKPQITKAIAQSANFIICLSEATLKKTGSEKPGFQDYELNVAYNIAQGQSPHDFAIIPLRLEACDRGDHRLTGHQQFDLFGDWDNVLDKLAVQLGGFSLSKRGATDERSSVDQLVDKLLGKAVTFHYAGDYERAYSVWLAIEELGGKTIRTLYNKGAELFNLHRYKESLDCFNEVLRIELNHQGASFGRRQAVSYLFREKERLYQRRDHDIVQSFRFSNTGKWDDKELNDLEEMGTHKVVRAESIGTFFNSLSPTHMMTDFFHNITTYWNEKDAVSNKEPYIRANDIVFPGTILGRIATYGFFINIVSECTGRVVKIFEENEAAVGIYQPLFLIEQVLDIQLAS
jgi:tetratricopeptide (TPR) repeat protein